MPDILKTHTGTKVKFRWVGTTRQVQSDVIDTFAESQSSDPEALILKKYLVATDLESYKNLVSLRNAIRKEWKHRTLPSLDAGVRLIANEKIESFQQKMQEFSDQFNLAVDAFDQDWPQIMEEMRRRLGNLFQEEDYVLRPRDVMVFQWEYVSLGLPEFLSKEVYKQEVDKFQQKMSSTLELIKLTFIGEFSELVHNLVDRLTPDAVTGQRKRFKSATISNMKEFFQRFKELDCTDDEQLQALIQRAESVLEGIDPDVLRENANLRESIRNQFTSIEAALSEAQSNLILGFSRKIAV